MPRADSVDDARKIAERYIIEHYRGEPYKLGNIVKNGNNTWWLVEADIGPIPARENHTIAIRIEDGRVMKDTQ